MLNDVYIVIYPRQLLMVMDEILCLQFQIEAGLATGIEDRLTEEQILIASRDDYDKFWKAFYNYVGDEP